MTAFAPSLRGLRHPTWYVPLFLPVIPLLALAGQGDLLFSGGRLVMVLLLLVVGLGLALGLPGLIDHLGCQMRKETELLRLPWLACALVVQVLLLEPSGGLAVWAFVGSCAVLAAIPFGAEFHHRTISGLLSQPMARPEVWRRKMGVLAVALLLHGLVAGLSGVAAIGGSNAMPAGLETAVVALALAWASTPAWTIAARGFLPGLVFSLAVPFLVLVGLSMAGDYLRHGEWPFDGERASQWLGTLALVILLPAYALAALRLGARRWSRLESFDSGGERAAHAALFPGNRVSQILSRLGSRNRWLGLLAKELRLQGFTWITLGVCLVLGIAATLVRENWVTHEYLIGSLALFACTTVLLAGAAPVAEERRLGTLEGHLLFPVSRAVQWATKLGTGVVLTIFTGIIVWFGTDAGKTGNPGWEWVQLGMVGLLLFTSAVLAGSGSNNTLWALLAAILLAALAGLIIGFTLTTAPGDASRASQAVRDYALSEPELWMSQATALLNDAKAARWRADLDRPSGPVSVAVLLGLLVTPAVVPALLAHLLAWRNFSRPGDSAARLRLQALVCLGLLAALSIGGSILVRQIRISQERTQWLLRAWDTQAWLPRLSPSEQDLWRRHRPGPYDWHVVLRLAPAQGATRSEPPRGFSLPLNPADRQRVVEQSLIAEDLREALRREAAAEGQVLTNSPPPMPTPQFPPGPNPAHLFRYGFVIPGATSPPPSLPPHLMRRYGLLPPGPTNDSPPTNPPTTTPDR